MIWGHFQAVLTRFCEILTSFAKDACIQPPSMLYRVGKLAMKKPVFDDSLVVANPGFSGFLWFKRIGKDYVNG